MATTTTTTIRKPFARVEWKRHSKKIKVKSFAEKKPVASKNYVNYDMNPFDLTYLGFNRGADKDEEQYKRKKVNDIKEKILNGEWMWAFAILQAIETNGRYRVIDGHHRTQAVRELIEEGKLPANYTLPVHIITDSAITSLSDKELARIVSVINDYDPRWREREHIETALLFNVRTAQELVKYKALFDAKNLVSDGKKVKGAYNWIYALAIEKGFEFAAKHNKVTYSLLMDNSLAKKMASNDFKLKFDAFVNVLDNHASKWFENGVRLSASVAHIIKAGNIIGFDRLDNVLSRMRSPKTENSLNEFFGKVYAKS